MKLFRVSAASSAHIKAEAEKNEKCDAALKKKYLVEAQEGKLRLRKEKEIFLLETEMAAADAKIRVLMEELMHLEEWL